MIFVFLRLDFEMTFNGKVVGAREDFRFREKFLVFGKDGVTRMSLVNMGDDELIQVGEKETVDLRAADDEDEWVLKLE